MLQKATVFSVMDYEQGGKADTDLRLKDREKWKQASADTVMKQTFKEKAKVETVR